MTEPDFESVRSYGCTNGDGNPYDVILINVSDGTTDFLCMPCFVHVAAGVMEAFINPDNPDVMAAMAYRIATGTEQVPGPAAKPGRRNAPVQNSDPDVFAAYDATIGAEDLNEEFR